MISRRSSSVSSERADRPTRVIVIARVRGCGFLMFRALWDTAFQMAVSPIPWAMEKGREGAGRIKNQMEARAAYASVAHEGGPPQNLEILADWAMSWRRKVYRVMSLPDVADDTRPREEPSRVGGVELPAAGGGPALLN
jgi:hypothetical protein